MKRRTIVGYSVVSLSVVTAALVLWLFCTTSGTRLVLAALFRWMPVTIEAERISGQLADELTLEGLRVTWTSGEARVASLRMSLQPLFLLAGSVSVDEMDIRRVSIVDNSPGSAPPYDLEWPRAPRLLAALNARIRDFHVEDVSYLKTGKDPVAIHEARGEVTWSRGSALSLQNFMLRMPDLQAEGSARAGFLFPSFQANLSVRLEKAVAKCDAFSLKADLASGRDPEQVSGTILLIASADSDVQAQLEGEIGLTRKAVHFRGLQVKDGEGRVFVTAEGQVDVSTADVFAGAAFQLTGMDIIPALSLAGTIEARGGPDRYSGKITLQNQGEAWRSALLTGIVSGTREGVKVTRMTGRLLDGTVEGELTGSWDKEFSVKGHLKARKLDPAKINPELTGTINLDVQGTARLPQTGSLEARVKGELLESRLRDRALTGALDARWHAGVLHLNRLFLKGAGFEARAAGSLEERLTWTAHVSDLSTLLPGNAGSVSASGWAHRGKGGLAGAATVRAGKLLVSGIRVAAAEMDAEIGKGDPQGLEARALLKGIAWGPMQIGSVQVKSAGKVGAHTIRVLLESRESRAEAALRGSYEKAVWKGILETLRGSDTLGSWALEGPASLLVSADRMSVSPSRITSTGGEILEVSTDMSPGPMRGSLSARWQKLNLARLAFFLADWQIRGRTDGHVRANADEQTTTVSSAVGLTASATRGSFSLDVKEADGKLEWNKGGLTAVVQADLGRAGRLNARITSPDPARPGFPDKGDFRFSADHVEAAVLQPFLPEPLSMAGTVSCTASGRLLPGLHLDASGELRLSQGAFSLQGKKGLLTAKTERAQLRWTWRETALSGDLDLSLTNHGSLKADFRIPVAARLPAVLEAEGPVQLAIRGDLQEKGLLSAVFPGLIQESRGRLDLDCSVDGTWTHPKVHGTARVDGAGAYLPTTGIQLSDVNMEARFEDQTVHINSFRMRSGPGAIEGTGTVWFKDRDIQRIKVNFSGERFQVVHLPEMEMLASPRLSFEGEPKKLQVRGDITIPELLIRGTDKGTVARPSKDVVMVGEERQKESSRPFPIDLQVRILLGDRALIKAEGVDARLEGDVLITAAALDAIKAKGEIRLKDGTYSTRGVRLVITRGRIVFDGGPAERPKLDVLALRTIEERPDQAGQSLGKFREVKAGVIVTGTPIAPLVRLYSEPAMPDADILSYMVLGQRASGDQSKSAALAAVAEALLSGGGSESSLSQLKRQLGPDTVDMKSEKVGSTTQSIVTMGKYLQPKLYMSYGRSLFTEEYYVTLRYTLSRSWEVESKAGAQTGANLYYRIEFD